MTKHGTTFDRPFIRGVSCLVWFACASAVAQPQGYPPGYGAPPAAPQRPQQGQSLDELMAWERQDMGVSPPRTLHTGAMHGPTPNQIPGGQVITTKGLVALLQNQQARALVFDVLGSPQQLPNAIAAVPAAQPGDFRDQTQQEFSRFLQQMTQGNREVPLVFYCQGPQCWMSYNAALRAVNMGYKNVLWYRGGLEAWQRAGLPLSSGQAMAMPPGGQGAAAGGPPPHPPGARGGAPSYPPMGGYPPQGSGSPPPGPPPPFPPR